MRLEAKGFGARRRFGQNFLVNERAIDALIAAFRPGPGDRVLEIGPGRGALTSRLIGRVERLVAIEIDRDLAALLRRAHPEPGNPDAAFQLVEADVLEVDLRRLLEGTGASPGRPARVIANLPYNIATAVILRLLEERDLIGDLLVMIQREVAARIMAGPGSRSYGSLSILTQAVSRSEAVLRLRPGSFRPSPKVDSEAIRIRPLPVGAGLDRKDDRNLSRLLRVAFAHRRKTLLNNLRHLPERAGGASPEALGLERAERLIRQADLEPAARPEQIPVTGFVTLLRAWQKPAGL